MTALEHPNLVKPPAVTEQRPEAKPPARASDHSGHWARLTLLLLALGVGYGLSRFAGGRPYFGLLSLSGIMLICIGLVLGPRMHVRSTRVAVPLFDLAWITFAMYLTTGLSSIILPLLYVAVALAAMRGDRWEIGTCIAGGITAVFVLAQGHQTGPTLSLAVAQATLLAAGALALRLTVTEAAPVVTCDGNDELYETLLEKTSDAVFTLAPETWQVLQANPAARRLCEDTSGTPVEAQALGGLIDFTETSFLATCEHTLASGAVVADAMTYARGRAGQKLLLRCNMTSAHPQGEAAFVQAIIDVVEEPAPDVAAAAPPRDDFSLNYIPSLTHELNNRLAAIRLSAELAGATGQTPNYAEMQQQVDRCQDVLQTVVLQILRSSSPITDTGTPPQTDLQVALERVLLLTRPQIQTSGVQLNVDIASQLPPVAGFPHELQEALMRVIIRSVKSMTDRDSARALGLTVTPRTGGVEIVVTDAGPGLSPRELAIAGGRSVTVSRGEDRTWEIVRDAVCRFGGDVQAANGLNGGMRMRLFLPAHVEKQGVA